jgi:hypothetical protein
MAAFELNELEGSLFKHEGSENAPVLKGDIKIGGVVYQTSIWKNTSKAGNTWFKAKLTHPDQAWVAPQNLDEPLKEDDIPW